MSTFLRNKTISKTTPLRKENAFPQFNVASHKRPGIRLSFKYTTTLLSGEGGEGRTGTATMFRIMLSKYTIFSTVLSKIVATYRIQQTPQLWTEGTGGGCGFFCSLKLPYLSQSLDNCIADFMLTGWKKRFKMKDLVQNAVLSLKIGWWQRVKFLITNSSANDEESETRFLSIWTITLFHVFLH